MGCDNGPSHGAIVAEAMQYKEQSLADPNGVHYMDHVWGQVWNETDLRPVLRTDEERFDDMPVRAWWSHGRYDFDQATSDERSNLAFEIPDEVTRRIQSRHAQTVMQRFFGQNVEVELPALFLEGVTDETRDPSKGFGDDTTYEVIQDDWPRLKTAIEMTAKDDGGHLNGQSVYLVGADGGHHVSQARVRSHRLELYISPHAVQSLQTLWSRAFKQEVFLEAYRRY